MQDPVLFRPVARERSLLLRGGGFSVAVHGAVLVVVLGLLHRVPRVAPYKMPGTHNGVELLTYYNPGSSEHAPGVVSAKKTVVRNPVAVTPSALATPKVEEAQAASAETGSESSALSGIGEGDINIALQKYFPYPRPDLSTLPHGTHGDVILDAVVDEDGKITELRLLQGLGPAIDDVVIATVKQWSYTPATRHGVPVPSKQELHFHYERG